MLWPPLALALILSLAVAALAVRVRMLTPDGGGAAVAVGTLVLGFGGWGFATLLGIFFLTSSLLTQWKSAAKTPAGADARAGTARTAGQVLANGAVPAALAVVWALTHAAAIAGALTAAIAAATADTWATEIGLLSRRPPRLITTWRKVRPGASGGVTLLGTAAAVAGAGVIAIGARMVDVPIWIPWATGTAAMAVDSLLGATFEGRWRGVTNDTVNFVATLLAAAGGACASLL